MATRNNTDALFYLWNILLLTQLTDKKSIIFGILYIQNKQLSPYSLIPFHKRTSIAAFTLIELLVTLCVLAILLVIAMPSFHIMLLNSRLTANIDALVSALNYARNTALTQAVDVQVCPLGTLNATTCGSDWANGWTIITQPVTGTPVLLKSQESSDIDPVITANVSNVVFDPHGLATTQSNFTLCDSRGSESARSLEVRATGYIQSGTTPGQAVWNNSTLACP